MPANIRFVIAPPSEPPHTRVYHIQTTGATIRRTRLGGYFRLPHRCIFGCGDERELPSRGRPNYHGMHGNGSRKDVRGEHAMKVAMWSLAILLVSPLATVPAASARAQDAAQSGQQQDSLAAAARRAREEKKEAPKAAKVWDNDNIPTTQGGVSVVGENSGTEATATSPEQGAQEQGQEQAAASNEEAKPSDKEKAAISSEIDDAKQQLKSLKSDLDFQQRKLALDQQMYYVKPDYASDKAGAAALKNEQDQIDAKQKAIDDLQKKIDDMQSKLDAAGGSSGTSQK
jgi:hypothetical protein